PGAVGGRIAGGSFADDPRPFLLALVREQQLGAAPLDPDSDRPVVRVDTVISSGAMAGAVLLGHVLDEYRLIYRAGPGAALAGPLAALAMHVVLIPIITREVAEQAAQSLARLQTLVQRPILVNGERVARFGLTPENHDAMQVVSDR